MSITTEVNEKSAINPVNIAGYGTFSKSYNCLLNHFLFDPSVGCDTGVWVSGVEGELS